MWLCFEELGIAPLQVGGESLIKLPFLLPHLKTLCDRHMKLQSASSSGSVTSNSGRTQLTHLEYPVFAAKHQDIKRLRKERFSSLVLSGQLNRGRETRSWASFLTCSDSVRQLAETWSHRTIRDCGSVTSGQNGKAFVSAESRPYHPILSLILLSPHTNPPGFIADVARLLEIMVQAKRLVGYRLQALGNTSGKLRPQKVRWGDKWGEGWPIEDARS